MDPNELRDIILNVNRPHVLSGLNIPWNCFQQTFEEWCATFDDVKRDLIPFEGCTATGGSSPQWERKRTKVMMNMCDIVKPDYCAVTGRWNSFSYRNIDELPEPCRKGINFGCFGFPEVDEDITFWIGSTRAHTPCHYDTYGCNVVVQVFGRKSWILLPPEAKLTPVRVPFEESSVYCKQNFYSPPSYKHFVGVEHQVYRVVLEPGMTLIVPPKWWHYVETLEPSLNFNTWLGLQSDVDSLISECITKLILQDACDGVSETVRNHIINPNEDSSMNCDGMEESYNILTYLLHKKESNKQQCSNLKRFHSGYLASDEVYNLVTKHGSLIKPVDKMPSWEFFDIISRNSLRHDVNYDRQSSAESSEVQSEETIRLRRLLNVCCNPEIVKSIEKSLLQDCTLQESE